MSAERVTAALEPKNRTIPTGAEPDALAVVDDGADAPLRRGYGIVDMRFNSCASKVSDYALHAAGCPSGFVLYGPYVQVPAKSEVEVSFEIKPTKRIEVYADIVSQMGAQRLAGLQHQVVEAGSQQKLGYSVHVFNADVNVESRIGATAEPGTEFELMNVTMTVR